MSAATRAWVGLGSNLGNPARQVRGALDALAALPETRLEARSRLYGSRPMGPPDQPDYVNAVARLVTALAPHALLDALQAIEARAGRERGGSRWGPRTLDLDLLLHDDTRCADARLSLPHPGIGERAFVLVPLAELDPELSIPGFDAPVASLAQRIDRSGLWLLERQAS
ncbi:MAG: 2-amino-4-hydroxy-6-hydroxymethyldihydropteridine diphosphokinase [Halofilum sp. (in: g-proteobacteria)]|nr:2-amino-4-hydroxy-6-hydroxymethyldihydropteridine diphosphokinase [Halofilum sp. (in: g-proteobacteria)]